MADFPSTRWTLILSAQQSPEARQAAMRELLGAYWQPLYVFVRRKGLDATAAQDAVQELVLRLWEQDFLRSLSPERGRLRSFLRTAAQNHLGHRHEKETAARRGGGTAPIPLDFALAERLAADADGAPEDAFDRAWAQGVVDRALARLRAEYEGGGRAGPFALVEAFFRPEGEPPAYRDAATAHQMSVPQLKSFLHRARGRFRELVRDEVAQTVEAGGEVDAEVAHLVAVLAR
jgi:DNA-directed RNA polymerase specialized sigma24 family protein